MAAVAPALYTRAHTIQDLTNAFNTHSWPSRSQPSTRAKHWDYWALVVTCVIAWGAVKGLSWELLCKQSWLLGVHNHYPQHHDPGTVGSGMTSSSAMLA